MAKLTPKQKAFIDEYLIDLNATQAAIRAGYSQNTASRIAIELLNKTHVSEKIQERMKDREKRTEITQDKVLAELSKIAFANGSDFAKVVQKSFKKPIYDSKGNITGHEEVPYTSVDVMPTDQIDRNKLAAISGIKSTKEGIEVKTNDKVKALELIGRHLGMFNDKLDINANVNPGKLDSILNQLKG